MSSKKVLLAYLILGMVTGCGGGGGGGGDSPTPNPPGSDTKFTVMIYGHADHNLAPSLVRDMAEMLESGGSADGFEVLIQTDFNAAELAKYGITGMPEGVTRGRIKADDFEQLENLPERNLDDPEELKAFVNWAIATAPADRYGLILWDHGGQWIGFGGDQDEGMVTNPVPMKTAPMRAALQQALSESSLEKFDFLSFDTCLMGGVEVLYDLADLADVYIANPEIDYGRGWDYEAMFQWLSANRDATALQIGAQELATWQAHHMTEDSPIDRKLASHVIYDPAKYSDFQAAFAAFSFALIENSADMGIFAGLRRELTHYSIHDAKSAGDVTDFVDIGEFAQALTESGASDGVKIAAQSLLDALDAMIVNSVLGSDKEATIGLSIYYPLDGGTANADMFSQYAALNISTQMDNGWDEYLQTVQQANVAAIATPPQVALVPGASMVNIQPSSEDDLAGVETLVLMADGPGYLVLGQADMQDDNDFTGEVNIDWSGEVLYMEDAEGHSANFAAFYEDFDSDTLTGYAYFSVPGHEDVQLVAIALIYDEATDSMRIVGAMDAENETGAPRGIDLVAGGVIEPLLLTLVGDINDPDSWEFDYVEGGDALVIPEGGINELVIDYDPVPDGNYILVTTVEDVWGDVSAPVITNVSIPLP